MSTLWGYQGQAVFVHEHPDEAIEAIIDALPDDISEIGDITVVEVEFETPRSHRPTGNRVTVNALEWVKENHQDWLTNSSA